MSHGDGESRLVALPILAGVLLAFPGVLTGGALYFRDLVMLHRPVRLVVRALWGEGSLPLWDPGLDGGRALLANPNHRVLHPTSLLDLVFSVDTAIAVAVVAQLFLAGWGMALLLRDRGLSAGAARLGGMSVALAGPMLSLGNLPNLLAGVAWVPLAVWAGGRAAAQPRRWLPLAAGLTAVPLLAGNVESSAFIVAVLAADALLSAERRRRLLTAATVGGLSAALGAIQVLPALATLGASERGLGLRPEQVFHWSMPPVRLVEALVPALWGRPADHALWWGTALFDGDLPLIMSTYVGPVALILAAVGAAAALRRRHDGPTGGSGPAWRLLAATTIVGAITLFLAIGRHNPLLPSDGLTDLLRYPERLLPFALLAVGVAVACGWHELASRRQAGAGPPVTLWLAAAGLTLPLLLVVTSEALGVASLGPLLGDAAGDLPSAASSHLMDASLIAATLAWMLVGVVTLHGRVGMPRWLPSLVPMLLAADLLAVGMHLNPTVDRAWLTETTPVAAFLLEEEAARPTARVLRAPEPRVRGEHLPAGAEVLWARRTLSTLTARGSGIHTSLSEDVDRSSPFGNAALRELYGSASGARRERLADRAAAAWSLDFVDQQAAAADPAPALLTPILPGAPRVALRRRAGAAPRIALVPRAVHLVESDEPWALGPVLDAIGEPASDPVQEAFVAGAAARSVDGRWEPGAGRVRIDVDTATSLTLVTEAPGPALLVVRDTFAPGWGARVDGAPAPVVRTDLAWRGVVLPAGRHEVVLTYRQPGLVAGAVLSLLGILVCAAVPLSGHRRMTGSRLGNRIVEPRRHAA